MTSSRWKRFAFFERQTLSVPPDILEDLQLPLNEVASNSNSSGSGSSGDPRTTNVTVGGNSTSNTKNRIANNEEKRSMMQQPEMVHLTVSTAALPLDTKPTRTMALDKDTMEAYTADATKEDSITAMWSSLTACTVPEILSTNEGKQNSKSDHSVRLNSQGQMALPTVPSTTTTTVLDGLVLAFASSENSVLVYCFDVTMRCNPPTATTKQLDSTVEDMDDWRGYWYPFLHTPKGSNSVTARTATTTTTSSSNSRCTENIPGIVHTAACRIPVQGRSPNHQHSALHVACLSHSTPQQHHIVVWEDPHLHLSCRKPIHIPTVIPKDCTFYSIQSSTGTSASLLQQQQQQQSQAQTWNATNDGNAKIVAIVPGIVALGTDTGVVLLYSYNNTTNNNTTTTTTSIPHVLRPYLRIPSPPATGSLQVVSVQLSLSMNKAHIFVAYNRDTSSSSSSVSHPTTNAITTGTTTITSSSMNTAGICCYDIPLPTLSSQILSAPLARHDLDGRYVGSSSYVDSYHFEKAGLRVIVARPDGLYSYSQTERIGVAPIDGSKLAICHIPPPIPAEKAREVDVEQVGTGYVLVASTDAKSGRDAVDIYDITNKLVAFHLLLSPGHRAIQASGVTTLPTIYPDGRVRSGRSSAVVLTSGGTLVTFTEKSTAEKISLLTQKNLYSAAIVVAYADPSYEAAFVTSLYQQYAEYLYRKGDFSGAIDQYMHTIGSLESSHVIFRYLDAPKIPLLVKYLEKLRSRELATPVHNELLRTCYMKLNDIQAAESIAILATRSVNDASLESILSNLSNKPKDALATICSLEAHRAAYVLVIHGASLARALPRETAGVVISLCLGSYTPQALAEASSRMETLGAAAATTTAASLGLNQLVNTHENPKAIVSQPYPVSLFASAFVEHPKILRLILAHCNRNKCPLTPSLRRSLLELTLAEWNHAKRTGDTEAVKLRHKEAIASLTDSHCREIGDYDALVIVQLAGFDEGELLLYERLQMIPMLLERYAKDGSEKSRRQMLAICQTDPEVLADVLGHFVELASAKLNGNECQKQHDSPDTDSISDEAEEIMEDIQEALTLARRQGVLPPVRIARILAGEGSGQFSTIDTNTPTPTMVVAERTTTIPLSVALDYVGTILEEARHETSRLKAEIEEYNALCNNMEIEIDGLLRSSYVLPPNNNNSVDRRFNIDELYTRVKADESPGNPSDLDDGVSEQAREAFWREMNQCEDSFDTISRFFAKGAIH